MHFTDKEREKLYKNLLKTLKPGGKLMISDYCRGEKTSTQEFLDYEKQVKLTRSNISHGIELTI